MSIRRIRRDSLLVAPLTLLAVSTFQPLAVADSEGHGHGHGHSEAQEGGHHHGAITFGEPGRAEEVDRTVEIQATDNAFNFESLDVKSGETIRFVIHNKGQLLHEFNIGMAAMHAAHEEEMQEMMASGAMTPTGHGSHDSGMAHDDPNSVLVNPGETAELIWKFENADGLEFACNVPGHYQAGMKGYFHFN